MKLFCYIGVIGLSGFLVACNKQPAPAPQNSAPASAPVVIQVEKKPLVVKGFYLGMKKEEVITQLKSLGLTRGGDNPNSDGSGHFRAMSELGVDGRITILYDQSWLVTRIDMDSGMVNQLFNVADMDLQAFAEEFQKNYGIPEMKPITSGSYGWHYKDETGGFDVAIYQRQFNPKNICIMQTPKTTDRKFD
jgi:hypothetical protein